MKEINISPRLEALRRELAKEDLDALFVSGEANLRYLSGYSGEEAYLLIFAQKEGANLLLTDFRYAEQAQEECPLFQVMLYKRKEPSLTQLVAELAAENGLKRLGFERGHISFQLYQGLAEDFDGQLCQVEGLIEELRVQKDEAESERLLVAAEATDEIFAKICQKLRPGQSELAVEWQILTLLREGNFLPSFPVIVASGPRGSLPHARPSSKKLQQGEFVTMDFGAEFMGYHGDMTRTVFLGSPTKEQRRHYQMVLDAHLAAAKRLKSGISAAEPHLAADDCFREYGYEQYFGHGLGHGVGLEIHERPFLNPQGTELLRENSFVTVEPGLYLPGQWGIRIEDTLRITKTGSYSLFKAEKELICL